MARREQMRFAMLPHMGGKFNHERFIRTGFYGERKAYPLPDTPLQRQAFEDLERERIALMERLHGR
jgi:hypothetical protein